MLRLIGICFLLLSQFAYAAAKIEIWRTAQGSKVFFVQADALPMADIQVIFDAGSARDGEQFGLAALTSALLDTGAGQWNADQIAQRFESVGANFGTGVSSDNASLSLRTLTDAALFDKALETMRVILTQPKFAQADFKREQNRTLAGIKQREESPAEVASEAFSNMIYGSHPYAHPDSGVMATVSKLKSADLQKFYKQYYVANNAMVVIVGNLNKQQAEATANKLLADLPTGTKPAPIPDVVMLAKANQQHIEFPSTQTHVLVGMPGTWRKDPDYFDLYIGNHILGGSGLVSKLFVEVREKRGLAYSASSAFAPMLKPGPFIASLQTRNDQTNQALEVLNTTLADFVKNGPTQAELDAAKKNIIGGFPMRFDTNKELAGYVAMIGFYDMPLDYLDTFRQKIEATTIDSIKAALQRKINTSLLQTVTVGNSSKTLAPKQQLH
ncbi:MAG: insulinase family protein [Gammaproteobacteria bacterium]|nr:insulinase family protein [Gammaproteobacteria bacterium]